ncbi:protein kinase [Actinoallomurus sp. NPDC050550]|uniref:WD40 repeat domain-containing serine/threonine protein kinase n=1 Tax=Actinoallomurus sp. NPDC050550 TaxID=3154937 RepID=UPI0034063032
MVDGTPDDEQELINGRYRLVEAIGQGGMGTVWRGQDEMLDREVAIKRVLFPPDVDDDERAELTALALREARATARLNHPGVVTIYDVIDDGSPVIVMELIEGRSLADILREEVRLPYLRVAEIGAAVLDALREAHTAGIIHRDLKPANVLITDRRVVITDFGVAQRAGESAEDTEEVLGTPAFMAPEQVEGAAASPAADLWSLGATLFNAVEGKPPFQGPDQPTVLLSLLTLQAPAPANAGPLAPLITALLHKNPEHRPTAEDIAQRLDTILRHKDSASTAGTPAITPSGKPPTTPPDAGSPAAASSPSVPSVSGKPHGAKPDGGTSTAPSSTGGTPASKPAVSPGAAPRRPHYVRPDPVRPHHVPARPPASWPTRRPASAALQLGRAVGGIFLFCIVLYACATGLSSNHFSPTGIDPSPSDPFGGVPSIPPYPPSSTPSSPPGASPTPGPAAYFEKTAISPDGKLVAFGGESGMIRVYDTASHKLRWRFRPSSEQYLDTYALAFSPDGQTLAVAIDKVTLWDIPGHKHRQLDDFGDAVGTLQFSADGRTLTALGMGGKFGTWNVGTGTYTPAGAIALPNDGDVCDTALSANGRYAACGYSNFGGNDDDGIVVWDIENNQQMAAWPNSPWEYGLTLSPDGKKVLFSDEDKPVQVWDVASHRQTGSLAVEVSSSKNALAFSPDGSRLAVPDPDTDGVIQIWDVSRKKKVATLRGGDGGASAMAFSADGDRLVVAEYQNGVLWNARSGRKLASWTG